MRLRLRFVALALCVIVCALGRSLPVLASSSDEPGAARVDTERIQRVVDDLKERLAIPQPVSVSLVEHNPLLASVGPDPGGAGTFVLSFETGFVSRLNDDELAAAVAHELGHVWIFTHFPFLQTEQLANEIAMRVVSRDSLVPIYSQVFERSRVSGDVTKYLGEQRPADH